MGANITKRLRGKKEMNKKNFTAWLAALFPINLLVDEYKRVIYNFRYEKKIIDTAFNELIVHDVLFIKDNRIHVSDKSKNELYNIFLQLDSYQKNYYLEILGVGLINLYNATKYIEFIKTFVELIKLEPDHYDIEQIKIKLNSCMSHVFSCGNPDDFFDKEMVKIFTSPLICDKIHMAFINTLYKFNQNKHAVFYYNFISDKTIIDNETLLKISSAYYMIGDTFSAQKILGELKINNTNNQDVLTAVKIVELINKIESEVGKDEKDKLLNEFRTIAREVSLAPKNANLLLKISSSILSHDDAINLMIKSDLSQHIVQTYNNIGALYLSEGYKRFLLNPKDTEYIVKADKYLNFAILLGNDKQEYSPYLELNKTTLLFCNKYRKGALKPSYKTLFNNYKKLSGKADSIYFKSIILCNCLILGKLLNWDVNTIKTLTAKIEKIRTSTRDYKIQEKIDDFLTFVPGNRRLPLWIITESHY